MRIDVLTLFLECLKDQWGINYWESSGKAVIKLNVSNFRDFSDNKHQTVDDYPYGGGAGCF